MAKVIKISHKSSNIKITQSTPKIKIQQVTPKIILKQVGKEGKPGPKGDPGLGLIPGGNTGDIIVKASDADYDYTLVSPNTLADKTFTQPFTVASSVTVNHNLNKYPAVSVVDSAGDEVVGQVQYTSTSQVIVSFTYPFSGLVTCN